MLKFNVIQYCSVKENRRLGFAEPQPNKGPQMLGFVPQPNLHGLKFLGKTYAVLQRNQHSTDICL
jgi:hypothetical protein